MLASPCFLRPSIPVVAAHAHFLSVVTAGVMGALDDLPFEIEVTSFVVFVRTILVVLVIEITGVLLGWILASLHLMHFQATSLVHVDQIWLELAWHRFLMTVMGLEAVVRPIHVQVWLIVSVEDL